MPVSAGWGVFVELDVLVFAGNTRVIAGNGISVVVGVGEGVAEGVYVCEGVPEVAVGVWVSSPLVKSVTDGVYVCEGVPEVVVGVWVERPLVEVVVEVSNKDAYTGRELVKIRIHRIITITG